MPKVGAIGVPELFVVLVAVILSLLPLFLLWRTFGKAGLPPATALVCLIPGFGFLLALLILAFSHWPVSDASVGAREEHGVMG